MNYIELKNDLANGVKKRFCIMVGEDKQLINIYAHRIAKDIVTIDSVPQLLQSMSAKSLFGLNRCFMLSDSKEILNYSPQEIEKKCGQNVLILTFREMDKRSKFFKDADSFVYEFEKQSTETVGKYILANTSDLNIPPKLAEMIADRCDNDIARTDLEINKLRMLKQPITEDVIDQLITPKAEDYVFDIIKAIALKQPRIAYIMYEDLKELKESPIKLISLLYTQFKHMIMAETYKGMQNRDICASTGLTFFQLNKAKEVLGRFTIKQLVDILIHIQNAEMNIKTGKLSPELAFDLLLLEIFNIK